MRLSRARAWSSGTQRGCTCDVGCDGLETHEPGLSQGRSDSKPIPLGARLPMSQRRLFLESIAETIADYREGEVPRRTPALVNQWVSQFPPDVQDDILAEMAQLLAKTYISRRRMKSFLIDLATSEDFCGGDPTAFWTSANMLNIQQGGNSQLDLLTMFGEVLRQEFGLVLSECGREGGPFVYLDDGIFSGGRLFQDLKAWIERAPIECNVRIVVVVVHTGGQYWVHEQIGRLAEKTGRKIALSWWADYQIENRAACRSSSDVLWPTAIPPGPLAEAYVHYVTEGETKKLLLRTGTSVGRNGLFSSHEARVLLEQQFLAQGLYIRNKSPNLPDVARPLGQTLFRSLGFGSTFVTFRNCPNNCPLVFWGEGGWFPLFPRTTNKQALLKRRL